MFKNLLVGSVFDRKVVLSWQIWLLVKSPYKLIKLGIFQMSITSSKISFGTQFKAHIGANHAARHLRLKKLGNKQKKEKVVQGALTSTVPLRACVCHDTKFSTYTRACVYTPHARVCVCTHSSTSSYYFYSL